MCDVRGDAPGPRPAGVTPVTCVTYEGMHPVHAPQVAKFGFEKWSAVASGFNAQLAERLGARNAAECRERWEWLLREQLEVSHRRPPRGGEAT